jgi:hypothetical protein
MTETARAQALGDWREELVKLKAALDFGGVKDLIVEVVRARADDRLALKEFVSGLMGREWGGEVDRLIASAAEEALDKEGKAFILRPPQPRVESSPGCGYLGFIRRVSPRLGLSRRRSPRVNRF